jgi:hypothetical protein
MLVPMRRVTRPFVLLLVAGAAFGLVSSVIRPLVPWPAGFDIREKLEAFEQVKDECDALYFGSSYVYRSFRPEVIDARLAERGLDITSFNFGIGGMDAFETDHLIREVLAMEPARLRWVFSEPRPYFGSIADSPNAFTERSLRWHTARATWQALRSVWLDRAPAERKLEDTWVHLRLYARRLGNYGLGRTLVAGWLDLEDPSEYAEAFVEQRGYLPLEELDFPRFRQRRRALLDKPDEYAAQVASLDTRNTRQVGLESVNVDAFRSQLEVVRAAGAVPIAVLPPGLLASPVVFTLWKDGEIPDILFLNSPSQHPELFEMDMRFDRNHLNRGGAVLFSELFADAIAERLVEGD